MSFQEPTREDDERLIRWLELRDDGHSCGKIAKYLGDHRPDYIRAATNRVRALA